MAPVDLARFIAQAKLAVRLIESGAVPARLEPDAAVLDFLRVSASDCQRLALAAVAEQVELLRPYVQSFLAHQQQAKAHAAQAAAEVLVQQLQREARYEGAAADLPVTHLTALTAVSAFKGLRFEGVTVPWSFPRAHLGKILHSLAGCANTSARLEAGRLVLNYSPRGGGRGQIVLLDQAIPDWEQGILRVSLVASAVPPRASAPRQHVRTRPLRQPQYEPPRHWLVDAAYALVDGLLAG